ncbi:D-alanine--D-alanine ligase [Hahella sp. CCB-MM4]|uniref:D-alanine--D-alanine ligase n=1 Tax=Hahella sp. (strain CCB-MM4) TaxID=1926491 RepID=UPI000B9BC050|nr:D-alanine--D-alanine ligase [Hahella sp. CCB-MM4]OZG70798.1 D-alanine--D-alanine ligase [Hahella sp. CCB-MM4]
MEQYSSKPDEAFDHQSFGRVMVLSGGSSAERDISLDSGRNVLGALKDAGIDCFMVDPRESLSPLITEQYDRAFIALHGRGGEDGSIQGTLELLGKPYTGSGILASALAMNKLKAKQVWDSVNVASAPYQLLSKETDWAAVMSWFGGPAMVKPAHEGSSIGMCRVTTAEQLEAAYREAAEYDSLVFAEKWIPGSEYTVAILDGNALPVVGVKPGREYYDYQAKYLEDDNQFLLPCGLSDALEQTVKNLALKAFDALDCRGWGRVDIILDDAGQPWVLEVNSAPGMNRESLTPMAAEAAGLNYQNLVVEILKTTLS